MRQKVAVVLAMLFGLLPLAAPARAHHAFQAEYDDTKQLKLTGVLTKVDWINPHIFFYMDVKDADGKVTNWALSTAAPGLYHNAGLNRNFVKVGDTYTVTVYRAKDGTKNLACVKDWTYSDGHVVNVWFRDPSDTTRPQ
jgi:Family of unknown function (DUF6152)